MIVEFIIFYFLGNWVKFILYKDNLIFNKLESLGNWINEKGHNKTILFTLLIIELIYITVVIYLGLTGIEYVIVGTLLCALVLLSNITGIILLGLARCKFCLENHLATIGAVSYFSYCLDYRVLIWGVLFASINEWLREFIK